MRACVHDLVATGAPLEGVSKIIHAVAKGLNIQIKDTISTRSAAHIVLEGGIAATLQIVDKIKNADRTFDWIELIYHLTNTSRSYC
jgi:hypothetical protein